MILTSAILEPERREVKTLLPGREHQGEAVLILDHFTETSFIRGQRI
jgi:hypothetical protein